MFNIFLLFYVMLLHLQQKHNTTNRTNIPDPDLNVGETKQLLDNSAAKHKLSVKPKKRHPSTRRSASPRMKYAPKPGER